MASCYPTRKWEIPKLLLKKQAHEEAQACYQESLAIYEEINDKGGLARTYQGLGEIACAQGEFQAARQYLHQALDLAANMNFVPLLFSTLNAVGRLFMKTEQPVRGMALFSFVSQHPASDHASRAEADEQLRQAEQWPDTDRQFPPHPQQERTLTDVIAELLYYLDTAV